MGNLDSLDSFTSSFFLLSSSSPRPLLGSVGTGKIANVVVGDTVARWYGQKTSTRNIHAA